MVIFHYICSLLILTLLLTKKLMKKQHFAILAAAAFITAAMAPASAQPGKHNVRSIADTIRTNSNGRVTITCSDDVEALAVIDTTEVRQPSARHESDTDESPATTTQRRHAVHRAGYRIQVYSDNNQRQAKAKAQQIAANIGKQFPSYGLYLTYNAPYWRLRVGDFTTQEAAHSALRALRAKFPALAGDIRVVRDRIKVYE